MTAFSVGALVAWLACFVVCVYLERRKLVVVNHCQGLMMAILFVLSALMTAPILLGHIAMDHVFLRATKTEKL
jgi:uncharacterized membrane protein YGL010W